MKNCFLCLMFFLISGCVASGPSFTRLSEPENGKSTIYLYRPSTMVNRGMAPDIYINEVKYEKLNDGGYQVYNLSPGDYNVAIDGNIFTWFHGRTEVNVNLVEKQTVYIRLGAYVGDMSVSGVVLTDSILTQVNENIAKSELPSTKLSM